MLARAGVFEADALIAIVTVRTDAHVSALCAVTRRPLLARIRIAQIQGSLQRRK